METCGEKMKETKAVEFDRVYFEATFEKGLLTELEVSTVEDGPVSMTPEEVNNLVEWLVTTVADGIILDKVSAAKPTAAPKTAKKGPNFEDRKAVSSVQEVPEVEKLDRSIMQGAETFDRSSELTDPIKFQVPK